jgi:hypothetical protein
MRVCRVCSEEKEDKEFLFPSNGKCRLCYRESLSGRKTPLPSENIPVGEVQEINNISYQEFDWRSYGFTPEELDLIIQAGIKALS